MTWRLAPGFLAIAVTASSLACGSGPSGLDQQPMGGSAKEVKEDPSFASDIQDIFNAEGCTNGACHGVGASAGLSLEAGQSYAALVGMASTQEGYERVTPEKAAESYLIIKLEGRQAVGGRMPLGGTPLDATDMQNLKNWINKGAKNN